MARKPALQLPFVREPAEPVELGIFRKQILPVGSVPSDRYGTLEFDRPRLTHLVERFKAGAYDMVPFLLADKDNRHHDDPERVRGEVRDLDLTDDGLFAEIETSDKGAALLRDHPSLPVSVRLVPDEHGEALGHVLGTLDPVWKGQKQWELIEASADRPVIDLSDGAFTLADAGHGRPAGDMAETETPTPTQEDLDFLRALRERVTKPKPDEEPEEKTDTGAEDAERLLAELLKGSDEPDEEDDEEREDDREAVGVSMSAEDRAALELAKRKTVKLEERTAKLERQLAKERFANEREQLLKDGVPPVLVELAQPVLTAPQMEPIELAGGQKVSPQETVRKMLQASKGLIEFSELGAGDNGVGDEDHEAAKSIAKQMRDRFDG